MHKNKPNAITNQHVINRVYNFDQNPEYHQDEKSDERGLEILKELLGTYSGNVYLVLTAQKLSLSRLDLPSQAYDVFWKFERFRCYPQFKCEVDIGNNLKLPVAVINLKDYSFQTDEFKFFDYIRSIVVLTEYNIEEIGGLLDSWIHSYSYSKSISFNEKAMVSELDEAEPIAFFKYMASHNSWYEAISVTGPKAYVENIITPCIDKALVGKAVSVWEYHLNY